MTEHIDRSSPSIRLAREPHHNAITNAIAACGSYAKLGELEDRTAEADTADQLAELARIDYENAAAALDLARSAHDAAQARLADAQAAAQRASARRAELAGELGLVLTASGYRTVAQIRNAMAAEQARQGARAAAAAASGRHAAEAELVDPASLLERDRAAHGTTPDGGSLFFAPDGSRRPVNLA